jgi:hypothetical protein
MTTTWRVAWKDGASHSTRDHDTEHAAAMHVARLQVQAGVSVCFMYEVPIWEESA